MATAPAQPKLLPPIISEETWAEAGLLPCKISVDLPLRNFTVRDLLRLEPGAILESVNANGSDVPVIVNKQRIGWAEFEIIGQRIAVRMTELL